MSTQPDPSTTATAVPPTPRYRIDDEPRVLWPDVKSPVFAKRPMIVCGRRIEIDCIILANGKAYIADEDVPGLLRRGYVLVRNLELTERNGYNPKNPEEQNFVRYLSLYDAARGLAQIPDREELIELPKLDGWMTSSHLLLRQSNVLHAVGPEGVAEYVGGASKIATDTAAARNGHLTEVHRRASDATFVKENRGKGRNNPGRLSCYWWSIDLLLGRRVRQVKIVQTKVGKTAAVIAYYLDTVLRSVRDIDKVATQLIDNDPQLTLEDRRRRDARNASRLHAYAAELRRRPIRPFERAFKRSADDFDYAARCLETPGLGDWRTALARVHRSMENLLTIHQPLEATLAAVSVAMKFALVRPRAHGDRLLQTMRALKERMQKADETGFQTKPVGKALPAVTQIVEVLEQGPLDADRFRLVYTLLKEEAVAPF